MREHRIRARACAVAAIASLATDFARAEESPPPSPPRALIWTIAAYLPNRLFDLCDVVRLHARVGTGFAVGARVTRYLPVFVGSYGAFWVGLPGPRGRATVPVPAGTESQGGIEVGPASAGGDSRAPVYGVGEVGVGGMVYVVGAEIGVDAYELADFLAGLALIDFAHDDF